MHLVQILEHRDTPSEAFNSAALLHRSRLFAVLIPRACWFWLIIDVSTTKFFLDKGVLSKPI